MASGVLANSRNALFFAGGVIAFAAVAALALGDRFTPQGDGATSGEYQSDQLAGPISNGSDAEEQDASFSDQDADADSVFGDYEGFSDDDELIDDTKGADTSPTDDETATTEVTYSSDQTTGTSAQESGSASRASNQARPTGQKKRKIRTIAKQLAEDNPRLIQYDDVDLSPR